MGYLFTIFVITLRTFVTYRMIKKKTIPSSKYTPYDDITLGMKEDIRQQNQPIQDTKHQIQYEEKENK